jgi:hypothetical protein
MRKNCLIAGILSIMTLALYGQSVPVFSVDPAFFTTVSRNGGVEISGYTGTVKALRIPGEINGKKVLAIGEEAFTDKELEAVVLPEGLEEIGDWAFARNLLRTITIPSTVKKIGEGAFYYNGIAKLSLPAGLLSLGAEAFQSNIIDELSLPKLKRIEDGTFAHNRIKKLALPGGLIEIGENAFYNNPLESLVLPTGLREIGSEAFSGDSLDGGISNKLTELVLPEGLEIIGDHAFASASIGFSNEREKTGAITKVVFPKSLKVIETGAFAGNPVREITIPDGVDVSERAFDEEALNGRRMLMLGMILSDEGSKPDGAIVDHNALSFARWYWAKEKKGGRYILRDGSWNGP